MAEPLVLLDTVSKAYGSGAQVLSEVSCRVMPGQRIALVGPSGSGKSTLLHLMAGLAQPTSGTISWPLLGARDALRPTRVQEVFQGPSLFPALDVAENVALPLVLAGRAAGAEAEALKMLARFGLSDLALKLPEELSGGQAQRAALARALAIGPDLVLADEPTGQLDGATATAVTDTLIEIAAAQGMALVVATHDPRIAARIGETWTVDHGRLIPTETEAA